MVAVRLKALMEERDISKQELVALLFLRQSDYDSYECGLKEPGADVLCLLAEYFDVSADYLLGLSECSASNCGELIGGICRCS